MKTVLQFSLCPSQESCLWGSELSITAQLQGPSDMGMKSHWGCQTLHAHKCSSPCSLFPYTQHLWSKEEGSAGWWLEVRCQVWIPAWPLTLHVTTVTLSEFINPPDCSLSICQVGVVEHLPMGLLRESHGLRPRRCSEQGMQEWDKVSDWLWCLCSLSGRSKVAWWPTLGTAWGPPKQTGQDHKKMVRGT